MKQWHYYSHFANKLLAIFGKIYLNKLKDLFPMRPGEVNIEDTMTSWIEDTSTHTSISKQLRLFSIIFTVILFISLKPEQRFTSSLLGLKAAVVTLAESGGGIGGVSVRGPKRRGCNCKGGDLPHSIHVWYISLHVVDFYGKCKQISAPYMDTMCFIFDDHQWLLISWKAPRKKKTKTFADWQASLGKFGFWFKG